MLSILSKSLGVSNSQFPKMTVLGLNAISTFKTCFIHTLISPQKRKLSLHETNKW